MKKKGLGEKKYLYAGIVYSVMAFIANWSILLGTNLMKWDIWDAHSALQVIFSDALHSGQIPLWMPLMNYGSPYYAMIGTPVWYPITILIDLIGYGVNAPAIEYTFHMIIAAMGMFFLVLHVRETEEKEVDFPHFGIYLACGMFYEFSGIFLSNAQHIMIFISAAWLPWGLAYIKRYIETNKTKYLMTAGAVMGISVLGGYPELFYDSFLIFIPWVLFWTFHYNFTFKVFKKIIDSFLCMVKIGVCTLCAAAITIIPFVMIIPQITRGGGQNPQTNSVTDLMTLIFPVTGDLYSTADISMSMFYTGILVIVSIPLIAKCVRKRSLFFFTCAMFALLMSFGLNSFVHSLLYRFFPMYSTFRFPTVWRAVFSVFMLLSVVEIWEKIFVDRIINLETRRLLGILVKAGCTVSFVLYMGRVLIADENVAAKCAVFAEAAIMFTIIVGLFYAINQIIIANHYDTRITVGLFVLIIACETLFVAYKAMPVTVAAYEQTEYYRNTDIANAIEYQKELYNTRNKNCNFSDNARSASGLNSRNIALSKSIDEEGYLSIILSKVSNYKATYNRNITQKNPEVYFTNDIVTEADISLNDWLQRADVPSYQIHLQDAPDIDKSETLNDYQSIPVAEEELPLQFEDNKASVIGSIANDSSIAITEIRVYFDNQLCDTATLKLSFTDSEGGVSTYTGNFAIIKDNNKYYTDIALPQKNVSYSMITFEGEKLPDQVSKIVLGRYNEDAYSKLVNMGFNSMRIETDAPVDGIVSILQTKYPGWRAYVDGKKVDILEVDGCFMGVSVKAGEHTIELRFIPIDFILGLIISLGYFICYLLVVIHDKKTVSISRKQKAKN